MKIVLHTGIMVSGVSFGVVVSQPVIGFLSEYGFDGGWPSVFYVFGKCTVT